MFDPRSCQAVPGEGETHQIRAGISARHAPHRLPTEPEALVIGRIAKHDDCRPALRSCPFESSFDHGGGNPPSSSMCRYRDRRQGERPARCAQS